MLGHQCRKKKEDEPPTKQRRLDSYVSATADKVTNAKKTIAEAAALFVAKDLRPFTVVEGEGFLTLAETLIAVGNKLGPVRASEVMPKRQCVTDAVKARRLRVEAAVKAQLQCVNGFGVTHDQWEHESVKTTYMAVTVQYVTVGEVVARVLQTRATEGKTAAVIASDTAAILREFGIADKTIVFVSDNARAMKAAFRCCTWLGCASHNLNLVQKHAFEGLADDPTSSVLQPVRLLLQHCKELVTLARRSNFNRDLPKSLLQCIEVRWDSRFDMLVSVDTNYTALHAVTATNVKVAAHLQHIPRDMLKALMTLLQPLKNNRLKLCQESAATLHLVLLVKNRLLTSFANAEEDEPWMVELKRPLHHRLQVDFQVIQLHKFATILVPSLRNLNNLMSATERETLVQQLVDAVGDTSGSPVTATPPPNQLQSAAADDLVAAFSDPSPDDVGDGCSEILRYLVAPFNAATLRLSPEMFWESQQHRFPKLSAFANGLLAIPATNLSSERNFNYAGLTLTDRRSRLSPHMVDDLLFVRSNFDVCK
ncbi:zinc finger BED domain-containing protein 1-like protein [Leptotrombidium deliense]|uniref:Zinc finger BED domain-containing protein 1-like protein n=1 Tax=Leptotrombidium deliense TaxID=299467 RepID=A0A443S1S6_9ACAR|nr:zinc finger BED domain-containing protein 1-like protein [Leptotrombidium deliense]